MNTILLSGVVGSTAYGLTREGSDVDRLGIFVAPTLEVAGLDWHSSQETVTDASPDGDDTTAHEVGKYLRLALKANPTITELLWLDTYETQTIWGNLLIEHRFRFLSYSTVKNAYLGYAYSQFTKFREASIKKRKHARHCMRILRQGVHLIQNGELLVEVDDPEEYFALDDMTDEQVADYLLEDFSRAESELLDAENSVLLTNPDRALAADLLRQIRERYV